MNDPKIILASTSPYRAAQLRQIHVKFQQVPPDCDEDSFKSRGLEPTELAKTLAIAKAKSLTPAHPDCCIIAGDQLVSFEGMILGKSGSEDKATSQLMQLQGKTHELHSAVSVAYRDQILCRVISAQLLMRPLTEQQVHRYVKLEKPIDCAGSYKIESLGISLFQEIQCQDPSAITGLPLIALCELLSQFGISVP